MNIHHIGYLVKKIDRAITCFQDLGYTLIQDIIIDDYRQAKICFLEKDGYTVELVSPITKDSVVSGLLKKLGNTAYHICYEVGNLVDSIQELQNNGFVICAEAHEAVAIQNRKVCFMIHPYSGMIELLER